MNPRIAVPVILLLIALSGCRTRVESLPFSVYGSEVTVREKPGIREEEEGILLPGEYGRTTPAYRLAEAAAVTDESSAFSLTYEFEGSGFELILMTGENPEGNSFQLPVLEQRTEYIHPLNPGDSILGFQVESGDSRAEGRVYSAGIIPDFRGIKRNDHTTSLGRGFAFREFSRDGLHETVATIPEAAGDIIILDYSSESTAELLFTSGDTGNSAVFTLYRSPGASSVAVPSMALGFQPDTIILRSETSDFVFHAIKLDSAGASDHSQPLSSDFSTILLYPRNAWRNREFELFRWSSYPRILVFDTLDYQVQSRFFKRLAFFVEKKGYKGTLLTNAELDGKHGWNAHDYRAVDLAAFFNMVQRTGFVLNREEELLREILVENDILQRRGETVSAGDGGLISISRESPDYLRRKFIVHEGLHGMFFADPQYREAVIGEWASLSEIEKEYWYAFFRWMAYEVEDDYLIANEYQAYMLQQAPGEAEGYFRGHAGTAWILRTWGEESRLVRHLSEHPRFFSDPAERMESLLSEFSGFAGGNLFRMYPAE